MAVPTKPLLHKACGGEVASIEATYTTYQLVSDEYGGWDYNGVRLDADPMEGIDHEFICLKCGTNGHHFRSEVVDGEVIIR